MYLAYIMIDNSKSVSKLVILVIGATCNLQLRVYKSSYIEMPQVGVTINCDDIVTIS